MNIVFYLLVVIVLVALWFMLIGVFKPLGRYLYRVYKDTRDVMVECDKVDIEKEKEN